MALLGKRPSLILYLFVIVITAGAYLFIANNIDEKNRTSLTPTVTLHTEWTWKLANSHKTVDVQHTKNYPDPPYSPPSVYDVNQTLVQGNHAFLDMQEDTISQIISDLSKPRHVYFAEYQRNQRGFTLYGNRIRVHNRITSEPHDQKIANHFGLVKPTNGVRWPVTKKIRVLLNYRPSRPHSEKTLSIIQSELENILNKITEDTAIKFSIVPALATRTENDEALFANADMIIDFYRSDARDHALAVHNADPIERVESALLFNIHSGGKGYLVLNRDNSIKHAYCDMNLPNIQTNKADNSELLRRLLQECSTQSMGLIYLDDFYMANVEKQNDFIGSALLTYYKNKTQNKN